MNVKKFLHCLAYASLTFYSAAHAQDGSVVVDIHGVGSHQIPIAIAGFTNEKLAPQQVSAIIKADLDRSGYFKIIDTGSEISETSSINYSDWKARGALDLVVGSVQQLANGQFDVRYRLYDISKQTSISGTSIQNTPKYIRLTGHEIADDIYEKLTGMRGDFSTRLSYVIKSGKQYRLEIADSDGNNVVPVFTSNEPIISPTWSPDGTKVAYVLFNSKRPEVWVRDLPSGNAMAVADYKGSNSAPAWSPDGSRLAIALSKTGSMQIYLINASRGGLQQLTNTSGIETEPRFSPDGQTIYFTSDRGGGPQIYKMSAGGGSAQRVTFHGDYNISPRISPDGKTLAYISQREGQFQLYVLNLASGQELRLSTGNNAEAPSFSPNGNYIMYATASGRLEVVSLDGSIRHQLPQQSGNVREPSWGPFMK